MPGDWKQDLKEFAKAFDGADLTEAFIAADDAIAAGFEQNFYNQVDHEGASWAPHAPATVSRHGPHELLILTGKMFRAATSVDDPGHKREISANELVSGIRGDVVPYAIFHHTGTVRMPRRRVIYATPEAVGLATQAFAEKAEQAILG